MSLYSVKRVLVQLKDKNTNWCLGRDMDHLVNSAAELRQGGEQVNLGLMSHTCDTTLIIQETPGNEP